VILLLALLPLATGCPAKKKAPVPAQQESASEPAAPTTESIPNKPKPPDPVKPSPMPEETLKATVKPPSWKQLRKLCRAELGGAVQQYAEIKSLGGARFVTVGGAKGSKEGLPLLKLLLVERKDDAWQLEARDLQDYGKEQAEFAEACPDGAKVLVSLYVSDYDWDGKPEVKVRHRFKGCEEEEEPDIATPSTHFQIFNAGPPVTESLSALVFYGKGEGHHSARETKVVHGKDLNGDGHPDLTIRFHEKDFACQLGETYHENRIWTYHWEAASDSYKLVTDDKSSSVEEGGG